MGTAADPGYISVMPRTTTAGGTPILAACLVAGIALGSSGPAFGFHLCGQESPRPAPPTVRQPALQPANQPTAPPGDRPPILLADTDVLPHVTVSWPTRDGKATLLEGDRAYQSPGQKQSMGGNMSSYVALGGSRLERGAGHPKGAIIRVGLYKEDGTRPLLENLADEPSITIRLTNVRMNQPVTPRPHTLVMHLKYTPDDLAACGLGGAAASLYLTADPDDNLRGKITADNGRLGVLDGSEPGDAKATFREEPDGTLSMEATVPYGLLRHVKDPWQRAIPGTFLEPTHFHLEFEVVPDHIFEALEAERLEAERARNAEPTTGEDPPAPANRSK